jgi:hypothetical protein
MHRYAGARLIGTLTPLEIIDIGKSARLETKSWMLARFSGPILRYGF